MTCKRRKRRTPSVLLCFHHHASIPSAWTISPDLKKQHDKTQRTQKQQMGKKSTSTCRAHSARCTPFPRQRASKRSEEGRENKSWCMAPALPPTIQQTRRCHDTPAPSKTGASLTSPTTTIDVHLRTQCQSAYPSAVQYSQFSLFFFFLFVGWGRCVGHGGMGESMGEHGHGPFWGGRVPTAAHA